MFRRNYEYAKPTCKPGSMAQCFLHKAVTGASNSKKGPVSQKMSLSNWEYIVDPVEWGGRGRGWEARAIRKSLKSLTLRHWEQGQNLVPG